MSTANRVTRPVELLLSWLIVLLILTAAATGLVACDGTSGASAENGGGSANPGPIDPPARVTNLTVRLFDVTAAPIAGAQVTISAAGVQQQATSDTTGHVLFPDLPAGDVTLSVVATDFETVTASSALSGGAQLWDVWMRATGAWAVGRAIVLATRATDRASDGTSLTFSVDIAVISEDSQAIETLTGADFSLYNIDCGWGGPRDCASDAAGNATSDFSTNSAAQDFEYQPGAARQPWLTGVLVERSTAVYDWDYRVPALKSFFTALGGNDSASLFGIQVEGNATTLTQMGPFTSDGSVYLDAIDQFSAPAGGAPEIQQGLLESIRRAGAATNGAAPGTVATILVLATPWMTIDEINAATRLARQRGVRISTITRDNYGFPEMAVRTGGFAADVGDPRQLSMVFGAIDKVLAGSMPYYRMQFRIEGSAGTFVPGGNAKVRMVVRVPSDVINNGVYATLDIAIP